MDEEADTLPKTQHAHLVMMTWIKEVWMGHLTLLLASISLLALSQQVKEFFSRYLSPPDNIHALIENTNAHTQANISTASHSHVNKDGEWTPTTREEKYRLLSILLYQALNRLPEVKSDWCTESLFDGYYVVPMIPSRMQLEARYSAFESLWPWAGRHQWSSSKGQIPVQACVKHLPDRVCTEPTNPVRRANDQAQSVRHHPILPSHEAFKVDLRGILILEGWNWHIL